MPTKALTLKTIFTAEDKFSKSLGKMDVALARVERRMRGLSKASFAMSKKAALFGAGIVAPIALVANEAVKFEDKMADVAKTTGLADEKLTRFGNELLGISKKTRTSIEDLATIGEIGGQLGIAEDGLLSFVKASNQFNVALGKDFGSVEEAINQVGKIGNLFESTKGKDRADNITKIGSAINTLGAKGAATSANITEFTLRLGNMPAALKPTLTSTLALGTALEENGVNAEIGAAGVSRFMSVASNKLGKFSKRIGLTKDEAAELLAQDPTEFLKRFALTFKGVDFEKSGTGLKEFGLNSLQVQKVIGGLSSSSERLTELQKISNKEFEAGTSLLAEYETKNKTAAAKMGIFKNNVQSLAITVGNDLLPVITDILTSLTPIIKRFSIWAKENPKLITGTAKLALKLAGLSFIVSGVTGAIGGLAKVAGVAAAVISGGYNVAIGIAGALSATASVDIGKSNTALKAYSITSKIASVATAAWNFVLSLNPIVAIGLAIAATTAIVWGLVKAFEGQTRAEKLNNEIRKRSLENTIDQRVEVKTLFLALRKAKVGTDEYKSVLSKIEDIQPGITKQFNLQTGAIESQIKAEKNLIASIIERGKAQAAAELAEEKIRQSVALEGTELGFTEGISASLLGLSDEKVIKLKQAKLEKEAAELFERSLKPIVNPSHAQQEAITGIQENNTNETMTFDFKNVPTGLQISSSNGSLNMPSTGSTRGQ